MNRDELKLGDIVKVKGKTETSLYGDTGIWIGKIILNTKNIKVLKVFYSDAEPKDTINIFNGDVISKPTKKEIEKAMVEYI